MCSSDLFTCSCGPHHWAFLSIGLSTNGPQHLVWKCRGLGNPWTIQELGNLVRAQDLIAVFIAETWLDEVRLKFLLRNFDLEQKHVV